MDRVLTHLSIESNKQRVPGTARLLFYLMTLIFQVDRSKTQTPCKPEKPTRLIIPRS